MLKVLVLALLTLAPTFAYQIIKPKISLQHIPVFMGMMGMWLALGSLLCMYSGYNFAMHNNFGLVNAYPFEFDWLNVAIIMFYGFGLFSHYYLLINRPRTSEGL
jgi:hypothetical protein